MSVINNPIKLSSELTGKTLRKCLFEHGDVVLEFDDETTLAIMNACQVSWGMEAITGSQLSQLKVTSVTERGELEIAFGKLLLIRVDLSPAAWRGPEAMVLSRGDRILVWR